MNDLCLAKTKCKMMGSEMCDTSCPFFINIQYQMELSSIPKKHKKYLASDLPESFYGRDVFKKFASNIVERVKTGKGLYLYSPQTGTGKSTVACALANEHIVERIREDMRSGVRTLQLTKFVNVPDFLDDLRRGMDNEEMGLKSLELMEALKRVPLVIMDDFGAEKMSEWARERLLTVISERYDNERSTIFTSNINLKEVEVLHGLRIKSRIEGMTTPIEFKGKDWRAKGL